MGLKSSRLKVEWTENTITMIKREVYIIMKPLDKHKFNKIPVIA